VSEEIWTIVDVISCVIIGIGLGCIVGKVVTREVPNHRQAIADLERQLAEANKQVEGFNAQYNKDAEIIASLRKQLAEARALLKAVYDDIEALGEGIPMQAETWERLVKEVAGE
jgi:septal ring factor EnvC (AmiA/AmiB activator)